MSVLLSVKDENPPSPPFAKGGLGGFKRGYSLNNSKEDYDEQASQSRFEDCLGERNLQRRPQSRPGIRFEQGIYPGVQGRWPGPLSFGLPFGFSILAYSPFRRRIALGRKQRPGPCGLPRPHESFGHGAEENSGLGYGSWLFLAPPDPIIGGACTGHNPYLSVLFFGNARISPVSWITTG